MRKLIEAGLIILGKANLSVSPPWAHFFFLIQVAD
jgi:hypothetical protein